MPSMVCKAVCTIALREMLPYILPLSRIRLTHYSSQLKRKNVWLDFLINDVRCC